MNNSKNPLIFFALTIIVIVGLALAAYYVFGKNESPAMPVPPPPQIAQPDTKTFCEQNGGVFEIHTKTDGARFDACVFHGFECPAAEFQSGACVPEVGPKG
jgi:hypothetical protein